MEANELVFFGKIAAGVTHEMKNVLATINESNGLMADFLEMLKDTPFAYREKFQRSIGKIEEQVRRGVDIMAGFNRFAHTVDSPGVRIDLNEIVALTVSLAARFARLRGVELKASVHDKPIVIFTNAFRVQMALTRAIEAILKCVNGGSILLSTKGDADPPSLTICLEGETGQKVSQETVSGANEWREFEELASVLDIRCEWRAHGEGLALFFGGAPARGLAVDSE